MGIDKWIFIITAFLVFDTYHDGKYTQKIVGARKYFKMATYGFVGISLYLFMKKHPTKAQGMMHNISEIARYMPVDSNTKDVLTPLFDLTNGRDNLYSKIETYLGSGPISFENGVVVSSENIEN